MMGLDEGDLCPVERHCGKRIRLWWCSLRRFDSFSGQVLREAMKGVTVWKLCFLGLSIG